jgi:hypothetical protein
MDNITEHFKDSLIDRANDIDNEIASTNPEYKELTKRIMQLEDELIKLLPDDRFKLFDDYRDTVLQRDALVIKLIYLQGFQDGSELKKLFS